MIVDDQLVSIIVPVYKSQKFVSRCIESIINQTYKRLEIILIYNPESGDDCPRLCVDFSKKYKQIKLIEQEDSGPSMARNEALKVSSGYYISFIDSDDFVDPSYIETLKNGFEIYDNAMISMCRHVRYHGSSYSKKETNALEKAVKITDKEAFGKLLQNQELCAPWGKLYVSSIFEGNNFEITRNEDMFLTPKLFKKSRNIAYNDTQLYYYSQEGESLVRSKYTEESMLAYYAANQYWLEVAQKDYPELLTEAKTLVNLNLIDMCRQISGDKRSEIKSIYELCRIYLLKNIKYFYFKKMKLRDRVKLVLIFLRIT